VNFVGAIAATLAPPGTYVDIVGAIANEARLSSNLLGAIQGEQPVAAAVNAVANGADPAEAAKQAADAIKAAQDTL